VDTNQHNNPGSVTSEEDISLDDLIHKLKSFFSYLRRNLLLLFIIGIIGAVMGLLYSIIVKPKYTAVYTFVLEDADKGGLGQYSGLASLTGLDISGGGGDIFQGDNIIELYKSRTMIEKTLLSTAVFNNKSVKLIDRYIDFNHLHDKWDSKAELKGINFNGNPDNFSRQQDSIISDIVGTFNKSYLNVDKPDKKLSIIEVDVTSKDELFAKEFAYSIVNNVNNFYVQTKTKKELLGITVLQKQADSVKAVLNSSITGVATAYDSAPNANPALSILKAPSQRRQVDVQTNSAIYAEMVKSLELAKSQLRKETPLIQAIDTPVLPLNVSKVGKLKGILIGFVLGLFLAVGILVVKKINNKLKWK
jgi:hypothetical protein